MAFSQKEREGEQLGDPHFSDPSVCKCFLLSACLNEIFDDTREQLGPCPKIHSEVLRANFKREPQGKDCSIEEEVLELLKDFMAKHEEKKVISRRRLGNEAAPELEAKIQLMHDLFMQVGEMLTKAQALGDKGKVEESQAMMIEVEELKNRLKEAIEDYRANVPAPNEFPNVQAKLTVCDGCGAFLSFYDNEKRMCDHFNGRLHRGFVKVMEKILELEERIASKRGRQ